MTGLSEEHLVERCLDGHTEAFGELVERFQSPIYNAILRMVREDDDAQDLTQAVFVKAYENLDRYDPQYAFFSWLYRMAVNETINFLNRRKRQSPLNRELESRERSPEDKRADDEFSERIAGALMELTLDYRLVIVMRHFLDFTYREMSEIVDVPEKTVKSRLFSARRRLCEILSAHGITAAYYD